ncbi:unnamed protein product [Pleuronectes platessa]|uniref:Uncharacterized protein n=1 Tax=Pleuronectes platessa TaxID=8262 RepID=A0A9N7YKS9_PLEPL|nr:unnamed protein product [Pleuronectes platessa]
MAEWPESGDLLSKRHMTEPEGPSDSPAIIQRLAKRLLPKRFGSNSQKDRSILLIAGAGAFAERTRRVRINGEADFLLAKLHTSRHHASSRPPPRLSGPAALVAAGESSTSGLF